MTSGKAVRSCCVAAAVTLLWVCGGARSADFAIPEGCEVSPSNTKAEGEAGYCIVHKATGIELLYVPAGSFNMGQDNRLPSEKPVHEVQLDAYWIGRTEVTVGQWRGIMGTPPGKFNDQGDDHPVVTVSWNDAGEFCEKAGLKLPTEAQWEYASRGPRGRKFPWGGVWDPARCQCSEDKHGKERTVAAGTLPDGASWCGALDLAGNVWDWCRDRYSDTFYATPQATQRNPECTDESSGRAVLRGGCYYSLDQDCWGASRYHQTVDYALQSIGFRVVLGP